MEELFWYTLVLNGSMIFHSLLCEWLFRLFIRLDLEYGAFIVSRISFVLSLSFIKYLVEIAELYIVLMFPDYFKLFKNKTFEKIIYFLGIYIMRLIQIIKLILIFFMSLYCNYTIIIFGIKTVRLVLDYRLLKNLIKLISLLSLTLYISIYILGVHRLYLLWIIWSLCYILNIFKIYQLNVFNKFWNHIYNDVNLKTNNLIDLYKNGNSKLFNYGFIEFINYASTIIKGTPIKFHLKSPFKYYSRKAMILTYIKCFCETFRLLEKDLNPEIKKKADNYYIYDIYVSNSVNNANNLFDLSLEEGKFWKIKINKLFRKRTLKFNLKKELFNESENNEKK